MLVGWREWWRYASVFEQECKCIEGKVHKADCNITIGSDTDPYGLLVMSDISEVIFHIALSFYTE